MSNFIGFKQAVGRVRDGKYTLKRHVFDELFEAGVAKARIEKERMSAKERRKQKHNWKDF